MPSPRSGLRRPDPLAFAIAAILCAAALVVFLQHRAMATLERQTGVILHQLADQTANAVAADVRHTLEGPVFDTLTRVNHPQIREGRLDLLAREYAAGLTAYPQVERFFVWTERTDVVLPGEALFYGRADGPATSPMPAGLADGFARDPALGRAVVDLARRHAPAQQIYAAFERTGPDGRHDLFLRLFWADARRDRYFAVIGFVIDRARVRDALFPALHRRRLADILKLHGADQRFELRVVDETGATVWGRATPGPLAARVLVPLTFYPAQAIASRLAAGVEPVNWTIEVSPSATTAVLAVNARGYLLLALSVGLMLVALAFTIRAGRRAAEMARMQAEFVSHVSHQLKTPLSLLSTAAETVAMDRVRSPEKLAQYFEIIRSEAGRLSALVQRILEFSRVQQRPALAFEEVDLGALVRETVDAFEGGLRGRPVAFRVEQDGPAPHLQADPAALEQVLANLLDNAVKYSDAATEVTVRVGWSGSDAVVEVRDRGIGIAPEDRRRIFEKFYRGSGAAHHRRGFGLGLAIVQELVAAHRGRIEVDSVPHEGSTFRIVLPVARPYRRPPRAAVEVTR